MDISTTMASTPSASALSAVLRCRGNILTRNPPTKRPAASAYSLGLTGGALRESTSERTRSNQASTWETFLQGERVVVGKGLAVAVAYKSTHKTPRKKGDWETRCHDPKLSQSRVCAPKDAHSAAPGAQNALVRPAKRKLTRSLPGIDKCSQLIRLIKHEASAAHLCKAIFYQNITELPSGVLKVSIIYPVSRASSGQIAFFLLSGWSTLKSTCLSLTALVSELMFLKVGGLWRSSSSSDDAPEPHTGEQDMNMKNIEHALQVSSK